jgi:hypothetical protein
MNINTVNVIKFDNFAEVSIQEMASYPDTPAGNVSAEAKFIEWVEEIGGVPVQGDPDDLLDGGICEIGAGGVIITHSTEPLRELPKVVVIFEDFKCPRCGAPRLEEIMVGAIVSSEVIEVSENGEVGYGEQETNEGEVDHYQCTDCGWELPGGALRGEELYEALKKEYPDEEESKDE